MGFFALSGRQLSILAGILVLCLIAIVFHTVSRQPWMELSLDRSGPEIFEIESVSLIPEFPIREESIARLLRGEDVQSVPVAIYNEWKRPFFLDPRPKWSAQVRRIFKDDLAELRGLRGLRLAFFVDLPMNVLRSIKDPTLFFFKIQGNWTIYANQRELLRGDELLLYPATRLPNAKRVRLTWIVENKKDHIFAGPVFTHGISVRSSERAAWAQSRLPLQSQLPRLIACIGFLGLAVFSAILAWSAPRFNDLWAFAAFCGAMFFRIWAGTPFYQEPFYDDRATIPDLMLYKMLSNFLVNFTAAALALSFFRVRGYFLWLILGLLSVWSAKIIFDSWPYGSDLPLSKLTAETQAKFVIALVTSQIITFLYGFYSLIEQYLKFKHEGLAAMLRPMRRRLFEATLYTLGMSVMLVAYLRGLPLQSSTAGPDLFLLFALVPALVVFTQFYWMMGAGTRFREKLVPQFDYVDYLVMELRDKALHDTYDGVLAAFDLKGFKKLMGLKLKSPAHAEAVQLLLTRIKTDLDILITTGRTVFRYKSNGDEWIYTLYAKDKNHAHALLKDVVHSWQMQGTGLLNQWKSLLREHLGPHAAVEDAQDVLRALELHVMFCLLENMTINAEGGVARPDYSCDSLTFLSPAFKHAAHNRVAMYATEAELVLPLLALGSHYEVLEEKPFAIGFY